MHALQEEFPVEGDLVRLEPRVARIEGVVTQLNSRFAGVEVDLRDLRKSLDQKLDKLDARFDKLDAKLDRLDARWDTRFEKLDTKIDRVDARFESKLEAMSTRRFTVWVTVITSVTTVAAAVLGLIFSGSHGH